MSDLFEQYKAACNHPGCLDEAAVHAALGEYCRAVGEPRRIERLRCDWARTAGDDFWECITDMMRTISLKAKNAGHVVAFDVRAAREAREARAAMAGLSSLNGLAGAAAEVGVSIAAVEASSTSEVVAATSASAARVARNALSDLYVLAARAARDARDAMSSRVSVRTRDSALRFASWAVHHHA